MRILVVGLDPTVLDPHSPSAQRQLTYFTGFEADIFEMVPGPERHVSLSPTVRSHAAGGTRRWQVALSTLRAVRALARTGSYDVLTVQEPTACGLIGYLACLGTRTRLHVQDHSAMFSGSRIGWRNVVRSVVARWIAHRADRIRTVSARGRSGLEKIGIPSDRIDVVSVPTDIAAFRSVVHVPADHPRLLTVARLFREKGVDILLRAFALVLKKDPRARLSIIGDGPERELLAQLSKELDLGSSVSFLGEKNAEEIRTKLAQTDVYIQPSRFEGWGIAVIEAAAAGVPVVMTDVGCAGEVIIPDVSGRVVAGENPASLAEGILDAINRPDVSHQMSEQARRKVEELPSFPMSVERVRASLESASSAAPSPRLWRLVALAFVIRFALFLAMWFWMGEAGFISGDGLQYHGLAESLRSGQGFLLGGEPFFFRTAGYPLLLAAGLIVFQSVAGFIFFQIILASFLPVLVYRLGMRLRLGARASWIAALLTAIEPHLIFYSTLLLTEIVFTALLLLALLWTFRAMETKRLGDSVRAGLAFGLGMFIKPLFQLFPPVLLMFFLPWWKRIPWRSTAIHAVVICTVAMACLVPWMIRNSITFGKFAISSQGSAAALYYLGTSIVSVRDQIPYGNAERQIQQDFLKKYGEMSSKSEQEEAHRHEAKKLVFENPGIVARIIVVNTVTLWTSSNYNAFLRYYNLIPKPDHSSILPPTHYLAQGRMDEFFGSFWKIFGQPFYAVGIFGRLVWLVITVFFLYGLVSAFLRIPERRYEWTFLVATCAYLTAVIWVDGLGIEARLRFPLMPIEFLFAAYGWVVWRTKRVHADPSMHRLLVITQRVDERDTNLAVHVRWLQELATQNATVDVIAQSVGTHDLPNNVHVHSLGKEMGASKARQLWNFYGHVFRVIPHIDSVLVLMVPLYVVLVAPVLFFVNVPSFLWYTHKRVSLVLRIALFFVRRVFSASPESFRLKTKKVRFLGHAIDTEFFTFDSSVTPEKGLVISVGRIAPVKRLEIIIDAVKALRKDGLNVRLQLIGSAVLPVDVEYEKTLRRNSGDFVSFTGGKTASEVRDVYHRASVCVNASKTGSLDKVMLEAMASGCPVVTSNEAFSSLVPKESFVASGSVHDFAKAIRSMIEHTPSREALREVVTQKHELRTTLAALMAEIRHAR
ncbi:glycosyltransferase [Patescibacteria group bacterium]|nr:glycosyltransferase [Patescibacteria group bacterium]